MRRLSPLRILPCLVAVLPLAACGGGNAPPPPTPGRRVEAVPDADRLYRGDRTAMDSVMVVINDPQTLQLWWQRATAEAPEPRPGVPTVDFDQHTVLMVSAGRMNNGDRIRVDSLGFEVQAEPGGGRSEVWFAIVRTTRDCNPLPGVRYPLEFVRISKVQEVRFDPRLTACPGGA